MEGIKFQHNLKFTKSDPNLRGFQEAIFSVSNIDKWIDFLKNICGWKLQTRNQGITDLNKLWHLEDSVKIESALMYNEGDKEGFIRLVAFKNVPQEQIRSSANTWDSGGIFDVNIRTKDMSVLFPTLQKEGWNAYADPLRYTFNIYDVEEVLVRGYDGITMAMMQRYAPPLTKFPHLRITSRLFNSSIITHDLEESYDFFANKLGWSLFFETKGDKRPNGKNVLGIPPNINGSVEVPIYIMRPDIDNFGSVEILELKQLKGKNCAALAKPPNLGILMLRFPVKDAEKYAKEIESRGGVLASSVQTLDIVPYGKVKIFAIQSPAGAWLEFLEFIKD